jgi:outer membrane protein OmpA-like peptidoglycan-associated protein
MKTLNILICVFFLIEFSIDAQNLINNSCFDDYYNYIDSNKNLVYHPNHWDYTDSAFNHAIYFSTDRFKNKTLTWNLHPDSAIIKQGQKANYLSILILPKTQRVYSDLKEQLKKGKKYNLKIDIKAFDQSNYLSDLLIGFKDCSPCNMDSSLYQLRLTIPDSLCNDSLYYKWVTLNTSFTAHGNEKVIVITSGSTEEYTKIVKSDPNKFLIRRYQGPPKLKYYIDNVFLTEEVIKKDTLTVTKIDSLGIGESFVLENIYFEYDKYELLEQSFPELDIVCNYLNKDENVKIQISGHTDNYGTDSYNDNLSKNRANSVVEYLTKKGIARDRLQSIGYGSKYPIDSNNTADGRQKNRRIEMKILNN